MKTLYKILTILAIPSVLLLYSNSGGSPGGKTGSPGDGAANCTQCHDDGQALGQEGWITTDIPAEGYIPGETYTITVTGTYEGIGKMGFELTAEDDADNKLANFTITDANRTQFTNNDNAVTHTQEGNVPNGNTNTWSVNWTAPLDVDNTMFYAAVNAANGNGNNQGDQIFLTSLAVSKDVVSGIGNEYLANTINVYPNPASEYVLLDLPEASQFSLIDIAGRQILSKTSVGQTERVDVSALESGIYFIQIIHDGNTATKRLLKN